jgi:hypothetical protein
MNYNNSSLFYLSQDPRDLKQFAIIKRNNTGQKKKKKEKRKEKKRKRKKERKKEEEEKALNTDMN